MEDTRVMSFQHNDAFSIIVAEDEMFPYKVGDQYKDCNAYVEKNSILLRNGGSFGRRQR